MPSLGNANRKTERLWVAVEGHVDGLQIEVDAALEAAREASAAAGLPEIAVTPSQGKLLNLLARMVRAKRILEIGTLGGESTIWLARALPPRGCVVTLEADRKHFDVARANLERAGLARRVDQRLGLALETLPRLSAGGRGAFDLVFIDADKENTAAYFEWALRLSRPGAAIVVDNVVRDGEILDTKSRDARIRGIRLFHEAVGREKRVSATTIQTVGSKGYDGFTLAVVQE
jgi:predicted O-methyltransferase YrrM